MIKKNTLFMILVIICTLAFVGCSDNSVEDSNDTAQQKQSDENQQDETISNEKFEVKLDVFADTNNGKPIISGETNLPDGSELMISITTIATKEELAELGLSEEEMEETRYTTHGQDKVIVKDGKFTSETFSKQGEKYDPNEYIVSVSMSLAQLQDESVQKIIGSNGENMTGDNVVESSDGLGNYVDKEITMVIN